MLPHDLLIEETRRCLWMRKPYSGREELFNPRALLAPIEEVSAVVGLKELEGKAMPRHGCSGAVSRDTQHLLLFPTCV